MTNKIEVYNEILVFSDGEIELDVNVSPNEDTVWLNQLQMSKLFDTSVDNVALHIKNIYNEKELEKKLTTENFSVVREEGNRTVKRNIMHYNLDVIISVGYRVKSQRGVAFRKWSNKVLKDFIIKGYTLNEKKLNILDYPKIIELLDNYRSYDGTLILSDDGLLDFLLEYKKGLQMLDDYDHQNMVLAQGEKDTYKLDYDECIKIIRESSFKDKGDLFAIERDDSFKSSIATIYQTFDGEELYSTLESKAANLLYLITKNHSFIDGNKRIAAIILLYFLDQNDALYINFKQRISNETLVALTVLVASSKPDDKESIVNLIQLLLSNY